MIIKIIYPDPLLRQQIEFIDRINQKEGWEAYFRGTGSGETEMIINKKKGFTQEG